MRLINTSTLEQKDFFDPPFYAILSHRWGEQEVSYEDYALVHDATMEPMRELLKARVVQTKQKSGYRKIIDCCEFTRSQGHSYVWIDTCCIDKRSSAELSESINSMYKWYKRSEACYVHLADVPSLAAGSAQVRQAFHTSPWFTRCWTLQELLAPTRLVFLTHSWEQITEIRKANVVKLSTFEECWSASLATITSIPEAAILGTDTKPSLAQRMSWAARREATREEDVAYSLLGLFDINMSLLYGEGPKAFIRLQTEIIQRDSDDESILAWRTPTSHLEDRSHISGFLASHPSAFARCGNIHYRESDGDRGARLPLMPSTITPRGLQIGTECSIKGDDERGTVTRLFRHKSTSDRCRLLFNCGEGKSYREENKRCSLEFTLPHDVPGAVGAKARNRRPDREADFTMALPDIEWHERPGSKQIWLALVWVGIGDRWDLLHAKGPVWDHSIRAYIG